MSSLRALMAGYNDAMNKFQEDFDDLDDDDYEDFDDWDDESDDDDGYGDNFERIKAAREISARAPEIPVASDDSDRSE